MEEGLHRPLCWGRIQRIRNTTIHLKGSPILALSVPDPFDRYIFCEAEKEKLSALRKRSEKIAPSAEVIYINGSCDDEIESICSAIPKDSSRRGVLSLCLVDPYNFGFRFETIRRLSQFRVDFLVLLAAAMDANRAYEHYLGKNTKLDEALGNTSWRERWKAQPRMRDDFPSFVANEFAMSMQSLHYLKVKPADMKLVRSDEKNSPLYYLALFSKHETANRFWREVLKYGTDQMGLPFGGD